MSGLSLAQTSFSDGTDSSGDAAPSAADRRRLWIADRPFVDVPCSIEIERSWETLYAHVSLQGVDVDCGDEVLIHAAPTTIKDGDHLVTTSRATVVKAGPFKRWLTRMQSYLALTELYEVGFQPRHEIKFKQVGASSDAAVGQPLSAKE
jgi:hypothetical protein